MPDHTPVLREHGYHPLRVTRVVAETHDASSFVLHVPEELRETFRYRPGQFCTFRIRLDDEFHLRSYSMSSAPETDPELTVTVKRVDGGLVSNWLLDTVTEGSVLEATKPAGVFCTQDSERPVLGFCGGSGVTPVISITKHVLASTQRPVRLLYANRDRASVIFDDALAQLAARYPGRLEVRHHLDTDGGFLSADDVVDFAGGATRGRRLHLRAGPLHGSRRVHAAQARHGARAHLRRAVLGRSSRRRTPRLTVPAAAEASSGARGEDGEADGGAGVPTEVTVILGGKSAVIRYQPGDTVLETARRGGLRPPFSCESGNCATCMAFLKEGTVDMRVNNALTPEEIQEGWILTCQGLPKGETVTVEYEAM